VLDAVSGFFSSIKGIGHKLTGQWQVDDVVFVHGSYVRSQRRQDRHSPLPQLIQNEWFLNA
jgi:hypothetical protein